MASQVCINKFWAAGGTGRRAGFKTQCRKTSRFDSGVAHQISAADGMADMRLLKSLAEKRRGSSPRWPTKFNWAADGIGRHAGLRNQCPKKRGGSSPSRPTNFGLLAHLGERRTCNAEAASSNLARSTKFILQGELDSSWSHKPASPSSNLGSATIFKAGLADWLRRKSSKLNKRVRFSRSAPSFKH